MDDIAAIHSFLGCATPQAWLDKAVDHIDLLLIDHAHCEKKAASSALNFMFRYVDKPDLLRFLSPLAREELLHFEKVLQVLTERGIAYTHLRHARYAQGLRQHIATHEPQRLIDTLIVSAFIEARSCERFAKLAPLLEPNLAKFYQSLLQSEARHYLGYIEFAQQYASDPIDERVAFFAAVEAELIQAPDPNFRFHSGVPV